MTDTLVVARAVLEVAVSENWGPHHMEVGVRGTKAQKRMSVIVRVTPIASFAALPQQLTA